MGAMLRPLAAPLAAALIGAGAAGALDVTVFADTTGRGDAAGVVLAETAALLVAYLLALRLLAPASVRRLGAMAGHLRRRRTAVGA